MAAAVILNYDYLVFWRHRYVLHQSNNIPTKFGDDWSNSNGNCPDFYGSKFGGFLDRGPPRIKFEGTKSWKGTCINRNMSFEPLSVKPLIATCGLTEEMEKKEKRWEKKVTKPLYFTTTWRRHFATDLHQIWWVCRSYRRNHAYRVWFQHIHWFFQAEMWKKICSL